MKLELTEAQTQALQQGKAVRLTVSDVGGEVVLLRAEQFEAMRELLEEMCVQRAFREAGLRSAQRWLKDN
jgi:hypothetical protein